MLNYLPFFAFIIYLKILRLKNARLSKEEKKSKQRISVAFSWDETSRLVHFVKLVLGAFQSLFFSFFVGRMFYSEHFSQFPSCRSLILTTEWKIKYFENSTFAYFFFPDEMLQINVCSCFTCS